MISRNPKNLRILAVAPSTRGFGFVVLEEKKNLIDWGVKSAEKDKNARCLTKLQELMTDYEPDVLVLPSTETSYRSTRIRALSRRMSTLAATRNVRAKVLSRDEVRKRFFLNGEATRYAIAEILAKEFPDELGFRLPPKRRPWMSEDSRMTIFDAVALALAAKVKNVDRM